MRLNKTEREEFRKRVKILIPQIEKSEILNPFIKEGYPRKNYLKYYKSYVTWKDNQRPKENWPSSLLDTCQKKISLKD